MIFKNNETIVFAGDSITDCGRLRPDGEGSLAVNPYGNGYVALTFAYLHAKYSRLRLRIVNKGISGDRSADLLNRYHDILSLQPDWIILMIGINDVWRHFDSPEKKDLHIDKTVYRNNVETIINRNKEEKVKTIVLSLFMIENDRGNRMRKMADEYRFVLRDLVQNHNLPYIDIQECFDSALDNPGLYELSPDGVHPNIIGHMIIMQALMAYSEAH